jgi:hypothetical protein
MKKTKKQKKSTTKPISPLVVPCEPYWASIGGGLKGLVTGHVVLPYWMIEKIMK